MRQHAFKSFWRMGSSRFNSLFKAAVSGDQGPPVDSAYIQRQPGCQEAVVRTVVFVYFKEDQDAIAERIHA